MNNGEKISNAIGQISQSYVSEYINTACTRPRSRRTVITVAVAATLAATVLIAAIPAMLRHDDDRLPDIPSVSGLSYEVSTDADGGQLIHAVNAHLDIDAKEADEHRRNTFTETGYAWNENIAIVQNSESPNSLMFSGIPCRVDTYCFDRQVEYTEGNGVVSYDVASGTTRVDTLPGQSVKAYMRTRRTVCHIASVQITNIYNHINNTGYNVGDVIYIYSEYSYYPPDAEHGSDEISDDIRIACAGSSGWGEKMGNEYVFIVHRGSRVVSDTVRDVGIVSNVGELWGVSADCTLEAYNSGNYYQSDSFMGGAEE